MSNDNDPWNGVETLTDLDAATETGTYLGTSRHTDAESIRRKFGMKRFDPAAYDWPSTVPGALLHAHDASAYSVPGGTGFFAEGPFGAGKSTMLHAWSAHLMDQNDEIVVVRASESRSEWTRFAPWAKVCLPASCDVEARVLSGADTEGEYERGVDLEDVVREVVYYEDVRDLNQNHLEKGKFHVVYPDPEKRGCQAVYEQSSKEYEGLEFSRDGPVDHWWFAWLLDRVENGPFEWTSWLFDEAGDLLSQDAEKDDYATYQKILLYVACYVDARKTALSIYKWAQNREDVHEKVRRKVRWRCTLNGRANPTKGSQVVGWNNVPMNVDLTSNRDLGTALMFTETNFELFRWPNIPKPTGEELRLRLRPRVDDRDVEDEATAVDEGGVSA